MSRHEDLLDHLEFAQFVQLIDDRFDILLKSQVQEPVPLFEHDGSELIELETLSVVEMVHDSSWGPNQDIHTLPQTSLLLLWILATQ